VLLVDLFVMCVYDDLVIEVFVFVEWLECVALLWDLWLVLCLVVLGVLVFVVVVVLVFVGVGLFGLIYGL